MKRKYSTIDGAELPADYPDIGFFDIDRNVFASHYQTLSPSELGRRALSQQWHAKNPSIYTLLVNDEHVVGYCNSMPLNKECFDAVMSGNLRDGEIPVSSVCSFREPHDLYLYICGIAIMPSHQNSPSALLTLLRGIRRKFKYFKQLGTRICEVGAIAWSDDGTRLANIFGLAPTSTSSELGIVYRGKPNKYFGGAR
jgi:hypothetical protein